MNKPVEIYTLNRESTLVPLMADYVEFYNTLLDCSQDHVLGDYGKYTCNAMIKRQVMPILQVTECEAKGMGLQPDCFDMYIAVEPKLYDFLEKKHKADLNNLRIEYQSSLQSKSNLVQNYEERINTFKKMPWFWRVWSAMWNDL